MRRPKGGEGMCGTIGETQKGGRREKVSLGRHPHCLLPGRVSPASSGLVNLISCQNPHDNESWLAGLAQQLCAAVGEIAQLIYEPGICCAGRGIQAQAERGLAGPHT